MSTETQVETSAPLASELSKAADLLKQPQAHATATLLVPGRRKRQPKSKPAKAKAKVKAARAKARRKPVSGQSAPPIESLSFDALNKKEKKVVGCFVARTAREVLTIEDLADVAFPSQPAKRANSWVRNSLRRLIRARWLEKVTPGEYRLSKGRRRQVRAD
jgi:hypothetical protein